MKTYKLNTRNILNHPRFRNNDYERLVFWFPFINQYCLEHPEYAEYNSERIERTIREIMKIKKIIKVCLTIL